MSIILGVKSGVAVCNGTTALEVAMAAIDLHRGEGLTLTKEQIVVAAIAVKDTIKGVCIC